MCASRVKHLVRHCVSLVRHDIALLPLRLPIRVSETGSTCFVIWPSPGSSFMLFWYVPTPPYFEANGQRGLILDLFNCLFILAVFAIRVIHESSFSFHFLLLRLAGKVLYSHPTPMALLHIRDQIFRVNVFWVLPWFLPIL